MPCKRLDDCLWDAAKNTTKAVAISRSHATNNPIGLQDSEDFFCFPTSENVVIYSVVMMFRKFYHLLPMINDKIRTIAESGLLSKWEIDSLKRIKKEESSDGGHGSAQIKLSVEHVEGAFIFVILGLALSFCVFLMEWAVYWVARWKKNWKFLQKIENVLCHSK